ncbi:hypothetical protein CYJ57_01585 [Falseniella ignava]|uniref:Uncharacterized protein n=1 Tax=Falseniella ignava TaxID=137730 RepID=A0A2I1K4K1_9LACT|nr:hypothetical protein [Falseniella ignava]PKY90580.1 hypothetical protein CYJ57_01585 [Falseniella ignava]
MKALNQFRHFDSQGFLKDKVLEVTQITNWVDYNTKEVLGDKVEVVILIDNTPYAPTRNGEIVTNKFEKLNVKVPNAENIKVGDQVTLINPVGSVYGEYQNQLSLKADGLKIIKEV